MFLLSGAWFPSVRTYLSRDRPELQEGLQVTGQHLCCPILTTSSFGLRCNQQSFLCGDQLHSQSRPHRDAHFHFWASGHLHGISPSQSTLHSQCPISEAIRRSRTCATRHPTRVWLSVAIVAIVARHSTETSLDAYGSSQVPKLTYSSATAGRFSRNLDEGNVSASNAS